VAFSFNDSNFHSEVLSAQGVVVVDFSATWCGPCKTLNPIIEDLARSYEGRAKIGKIDIDENQDITERFGITSVPTVLFFKNGEKVDSAVGLNSRAFYQKKIDSLL
jgi:thioredoxin 1